MQQSYKLNHPLYPHPLAIELCNKENIEYKPIVNSVDNDYDQWYTRTRKDIDKGNAPDRKLWHFVTSIKRYYDPTEGEKVSYREIIQGFDKNMIIQTFAHEVGMFHLNEIQTYWDYSIQDTAKRFTGSVMSHYYLNYSEQLIRDLQKLKPDRGRQLYYILDQAHRKHTNDIFFTDEAFAKLPYYDLYEIAASKIVSDSLRDKVRKLNEELRVQTTSTSNKGKV